MSYITTNKIDGNNRFDDCCIVVFDTNYGDNIVPLELYRHKQNILGIYTTNETITLNTKGYAYLIECSKDYAIYLKDLENPNYDNFFIRDKDIELTVHLLTIIQTNVKQNYGFKLIDGGQSEEDPAVLLPNIYYYFTNVPTYIDLTLDNDSTDITNEYIFRFNISQYDDVENMRLIFDTELYWANGNAPVFTTGRAYEISIINQLATYNEFNYVSQ